MCAKLILTVHDSVTAPQLSVFSVYFNNYRLRFPQIVTAAAVVKLRHTLRHSTCVSMGFGIIGRHKILCVQFQAASKLDLLSILSSSSSKASLVGNPTPHAKERPDLHSSTHVQHGADMYDESETEDGYHR